MGSELWKYMRKQVLLLSDPPLKNMNVSLYTQLTEAPLMHQHQLYQALCADECPSIIGSSAPKPSVHSFWRTPGKGTQDFCLCKLLKPSREARHVSRQERIHEKLTSFGIEERTAFLKIKCFQWSSTTCTKHSTRAKQNWLAGLISMQTLHSMKGTDFDFFSTVRCSAEDLQQTQEKRKAHILIANVPHPKHNSERFFLLWRSWISSSKWQKPLAIQDRVEKSFKQTERKRPSQKTSTQNNIVSCAPSPSNIDGEITTSMFVASWHKILKKN